MLSSAPYILIELIICINPEKYFNSKYSKQCINEFEDL